MSDDQYRLAVVIASVRAGRFGPVVGGWFAELAARRPEVKADLVDLADFTLPEDLGGGGDAAAFRARIGAADAFVVVTPEYNHSFPGSLKTALDTVGAEWRGKPVGFVSYGGLSGGLRSVEALRIVFAELHTVTVRNTVSLHLARSLFNEQGALREPQGPDTAAGVLLDQLGWWARALKQARDDNAYVV
jgi:NAD(P)H-dependent FMN reductase